MEATLDPERIARLTAEVLAELRGLRAPASTPASPLAGAAGLGSPVAQIKPYGAGGSGAASSGGGYAPGATMRPEEVGISPDGRPTVTCNVSNRHIHLLQEHLEILFGKGAELHPRNELMQPGQFAAKETVSLIAGRGRAIENVRILGPCRRFTQIEISRTDAFFLGIRPPVRASGNVKGSAGGTLVGPKGTLVLSEGIIIADRHIHTPPEVAARFGLADNQLIRARVFHTDKPTIFEKVRIRISDEFVMEMHLDNDDANSAGFVSGDRLEMVF